MKAIKIKNLAEDTISNTPRISLRNLTKSDQIMGMSWLSHHFLMTLLVALYWAQCTNCFFYGRAMTGVPSKARNRGSRQLSMNDRDFWDDAAKEGRSRDPIRSILNLFHAEIPTTNDNTKPARRVPVNRAYNTLTERRDAMSGDHIQSNFIFSAQCCVSCKRRQNPRELGLNTQIDSIFIDSF